MLNYFQDDQAHTRVYVAGGAGEAMGRAGFLLGTIYQPIDVMETQTFENAGRMSLSDTTRLPDGSWTQSMQQGPVRLLFQVPAQQVVPDPNNDEVTRTYEPGQWYLFD